MRVILTGCAGFIGMHVSKALLNLGHEIVGIDNINDYYDPELKYLRLEQLRNYKNFNFHRGDIADNNFLKNIFSDARPTQVLNLAAQPGVRYSLKNPSAYVHSNLVGFANILECCKQFKVGHLLYASSSSVYGKNTKMPLSETDNTDNPISLYAATKKSNELLAHSYSHLYGFSTTGLRYFTVYGPWTRPDMSLWLFTEAILAGQPISVFNYGNMMRDFTYIDDIVEGTLKVFSKFSNRLDGGRHSSEIYNLGSHKPIELKTFINILEEKLNVEARLNFLPMQAGDVLETFADMSRFSKDFNFLPKIEIEEGVSNWVKWFLDYKQGKFAL